MPSVRRSKPHQAATAVQPEPPLLDAGRFHSENRRRLSGPGLRAFLAIADSWGLTEQERLRVLGTPSRSTYHSWVGKARNSTPFTLSVDDLARISAVLGIWKALRILFPREDDAVRW